MYIYTGNKKKIVYYFIEKCRNVLYNFSFIIIIIIKYRYKKMLHNKQNKKISNKYIKCILSLYVCT